LVSTHRRRDRNVRSCFSGACGSGYLPGQFERAERTQRRSSLGPGGNTATASWNYTLANLATPPVTDYHIHTGTATQQGSVFIGFGVQGSDTLNATTFIGSRTGLSSANMTTVLSNPIGFYLNLHNGESSPAARSAGRSLNRQWDCLGCPPLR
jgi:hypothetical protein